MRRLCRLLYSKEGNMTFLAIILFIVIVFVALAVYTWSILYTNYYGAQLTLERSINSAVEEFLNSYEVKDVVVRVDPEAMRNLISENMVENGLTAQDGGYALMKDDYVTYSISDVDITGTNEYVTVSGTLAMNMPWGLARGIVWRTPVSATSRLTFISRAD